MKRYKDWSPTQFDVKGLSADSKDPYRDWLVVGVIKTRDSDALDRSNFDAMTKYLLNEDPERNDHNRASFGHWACGWFEILMVKPGSKAFIEATKQEARLENYPVLDEFLMSEYEMEDGEDQ